MNLVVINGRLTADPEIKNFSDGSEYCNFTVAVDRDYKNKDGERTANFIPCTVTRKSAVFLQKYFHKGDGINIIGALESRKYVDKDGTNRTAWNVNVNKMNFPLGKSNTERSDMAPDQFESIDDDAPGEVPF